MGQRIKSYYQGVTNQFLVTDCAECGVVFAIPTSLEDRRREDHKAFYCPNGHSMVFGQKNASEQAAEEARAQAKRERDRAERLRVQMVAEMDQRRAAEREAAEAKASEVRLRWRIGNGVCPCCHRTFPALASHVATKHPEFVHQDIEALSTRMRSLLATIWRASEEQDAAVLNVYEIGGHMGTVRALENRGLVAKIDYDTVALTETGWPIAQVACQAAERRG